MIEEYKEIIAYIILVLAYFLLVMPVLFGEHCDGYKGAVCAGIMLHVALAVFAFICFIIVWAFEVAF